MTPLTFTRAISWPTAVLGLTCLLLSHGALAQAKPKYGVDRPLGDDYVAAKSVSGDQTRIVMYRADSEQPSKPITLYINDRYHASLQPKAYSVVCLPPAKQVLRARAAQALELEAEPRLPLIAFGGQSQYVRVTESAAGARPALEWVAAQVAETEMAKTRQQMHTLSRVPSAKPCKEIDPASPKQLPQVVTTGAELWFQDNKSNLKAITDASRLELNQLLAKLQTKQQDDTLFSVQVVGYGDTEIETSKNEQLAKTRAFTVREYLIAKGIQPDAISHSWQGQKQLNRRVEVVVMYRFD